MGDINGACEAVALMVATIDGLLAKAYVDDNITPPEAHVFNRAFDPRLTMGGSPKREVAVGVRVFVKRMEIRQAQEKLRGYMDQSGPQSIIEAVENSDNWPDDVDMVEVVLIGSPFETGTAGTGYLAVEFDVDIVL